MTVKEVKKIKRNELQKQIKVASTLIKRNRNNWGAMSYWKHYRKYLRKELSTL